MGLNVLIVDDSAVMRSIISRSLRLSGLPLGELYQAPDGQQGLQSLDEHWIDVVLLDINMPVMNGMEMIERMRGNPETATLPIVVISTESSETRIEKIRRMGAGFVHKPFTPETLREAIRASTGVADDCREGARDDDGAATDRSRDF